MLLLSVPLLLLSLLLLFLGSADAMYPKACYQNNQFSDVCCPPYNGSECGAAYNRGNCVRLPQSRTVEDPDADYDDRYYFPIFYSTAICVCKGNFMGPACEDCKFGWTGTNCDIQSRGIRYEWRELSDAAMELYLAKMHYCKTKIDPTYCIIRTGDRIRKKTYQCIDASYWDSWCFVHYWATKPFVNRTQEVYMTNFAHSSSNFPTWHRYYMLLLEKQMQRCLKDSSFRLIYFDWANDPNCTACTDKCLGANDNQGTISKYSVISTWKAACANFDFERTYCLMSDCICERPPITRNPGTVPGLTKPGAADVRYCLSLPTYDRYPYNPTSGRCFRNCLEGWMNRYEQQSISLHNAWHVYCGGTMAQVPISCNDPMFAMHHAWLDKIMEMYIRKFNLNQYSYPSDNPIYGHRATDCIFPSVPCILPGEMMISLVNYGSDYSRMDVYT